MNDSEKIIILGKTCYMIEHDNLTLSHGTANIWIPESLYIAINPKKITYGIFTKIENYNVIDIPYNIFIYCTYNLNPIDLFILRFISKYTNIHFVDKVPLLPKPKIYFHEKKGYTVKEILQMIRKVFVK